MVQNVEKKRDMKDIFIINGKITRHICQLMISSGPGWRLQTIVDSIVQIRVDIVQGGPKKRVISKTMAITSLKSIRKGYSAFIFFAISPLILKGLVPILQH